MVILTDLTGRRFQRLIVIRRDRLEERRPHWLCRCDCGKEKTVRASHLQSGLIRSCGCLRSERSKKWIATLHRAATKTGLSKSTTYSVWSAMKSRCFNPSSDHFHNYGGRGITVCERWLQFENFIADMGLQPPKMTVERIDNDGHYAPGNCRWASRKEQGNNRRDNAVITFNGETLTLSQWSEVTGIHRNTIDGRLKAGLPIDQILDPKRPRNLDGLKLGGRANGERCRKLRESH